MYKHSAFLTAEWRKLAMINYVVDPQVLMPFLPHRTEMDYWNGSCYVSLVGFRFINTRLRGIPIPFHRNFEEVNLRFYVRFKAGSEWKRGVVFIREIVPKPALTFVANRVYKENYVTMPMRHSCEVDDNKLVVRYEWRSARWNSMEIAASTNAYPVAGNSEEAFITEHYWGYTKREAGITSEYGVEHPGWEVYPKAECSVDVAFDELYGKQFGFLATQVPHSAILAEGSDIVVRNGNFV